MTEDSLYQQRILELAKHARTAARLENSTATATLKNPSCGDQVTIDLAIDDHQVIIAIGLEIRGCALCEAAAGLALHALPGQAVSTLQNHHDALRRWLAGTTTAPSLDQHDAFTPVRDFGSRHNCVCLPFQAAAQAFAAGAEEAD